MTAGNASGINDGAAALVVMSDEAASELGLKPFAYIRGFATAGVDPRIMGIGPAYAVRKLLSQTGTTLDEIDLIGCTGQPVVDLVVGQFRVFAQDKGGDARNVWA